MQSLYFLSNTAIGKTAYVKTKAYYNTFLNGLYSYDNANYNTQTTSKAFRSYYSDYAYGGSIENRVRLVVEVTEAVVKVWGGDRVGIRLSPVTPNIGNTPLDSQVMATYSYLIQQLNRFNLAYLHMVEGATGQSRDIPADVNFAELVDLFNGPYMANNLYTGEMAKAARADNQADLICFGRPFIANPDLVERLKNNWLVDYETQAGLYAVMVDNGGNTQVSVWDKNPAR